MANRRNLGCTFVFLFALTWSSLGLAESRSVPISPLMQAQKIVEKNSRIQTLMREIKQQAAKIKSSPLRNQVLDFLSQPNFQIARWGGDPSKMARIREKLKSENMIQGVEEIFPSWNPMPFNVAPGGKWTENHHSYPGGLVYHVSLNLRVALAMTQGYKDIYDVPLNEDLIRAMVIWHDIGKTWTLRWNPDGSLNDEIKIAGATAHHILSMAEAIYRGFPPEYIVALGAAHDVPVLNEPASGQGLGALVKYLKAAAIIAGGGVPQYSLAGLSKDGTSLERDPRIEAFVSFLSDADGVLTGFTLKKVAHDLPLCYRGAENLWERNRILSEKGDLSLYWKLITPSQMSLMHCDK